MKICKVEGCGKKLLAKGYCSKHYSQVRRTGKVLERTIKDKNEITKDGDVAYIQLYDIKSNLVERAIIDAGDIDLVKDHKWFARNSRNTSKYCQSSEVGQLHRFLLKLEKGDGKVVDHINGDPLDNRKQNLRLCTNQENIRKHKKL